MWRPARGISLDLLGSSWFSNYIQDQFTLHRRKYMQCHISMRNNYFHAMQALSSVHIERIRGAFCDDALYKLKFTFTFTRKSEMLKTSKLHYYHNQLNCVKI